MLKIRRVLPGLIIAASLLAPAGNTLVAQVGPHDVALGKSASQWSTYFGAVAGRAVDGQIDGGRLGSFMALAWDGNPFGWWMVDLGGDYDITSITLWNRTDGGAWRLDDFFLSILATGTPNPTSPVAPTVFTQHVTTAVGVSQTFTPGSGTFGRYVKIQYDGAPGFSDNYLQLAEVDVEGFVHVTASPEPSSLALLCTGLLGVVAHARRRWKQ